MTAALRATMRPAVLLGGLLLAELAFHALPGGGGAALLGVGGRLGAAPLHPAALVLLGAAACAIGLPRQLVCYAAGVAFGAPVGIPVALAAQLLGCVADLTWARLIGRRWVAARLRGRLARLDAALSRQPFLTVLTLRLLPVGSNLLLNLAAGISGVAVAPFLAASALGYLPHTLVFVLAGSGVRLGHAAQLLIAVAMFVLSAALGLCLYRRQRESGGTGVSAGVPVAAIPPR